MVSSLRPLGATLAQMLGETLAPEAAACNRRGTDGLNSHEMRPAAHELRQEIGPIASDQTAFAARLTGFASLELSYSAQVSCDLLTRTPTGSTVTLDRCASRARGGP
jgi:hypothetical protein